MVKECVCDRPNGRLLHLQRSVFAFTVEPEFRLAARTHTHFPGVAASSQVYALLNCSVSSGVAAATQVSGRKPAPFEEKAKLHASPPSFGFVESCPYD